MLARGDKVSSDEYWKFCTRLLDDNDGPFSKDSPEYANCWRYWNGANINVNANPNNGDFYNKGTERDRYDWCENNEYLDNGKITGMNVPPPALGTCKWEWGNRNAYRHDKRKSKKFCNDQRKCNFGIGTATVLTKNDNGQDQYSERYSNFFTDPGTNKWYY